MKIIALKIGRKASSNGQLTNTDFDAAGLRAGGRATRLLRPQLQGIPQRPGGSGPLAGDRRNLDAVIDHRLLNRHGATGAAGAATRATGPGVGSINRSSASSSTMSPMLSGRPTTSVTVSRMRPRKRSLIRFRTTVLETESTKLSPEISTGSSLDSHICQTTSDTDSRREVAQAPHVSFRSSTVSSIVPTLIPTDFATATGSLPLRVWATQHLLRACEHSPQPAWSACGLVEWPRRA